MPIQRNAITPTIIKNDRMNHGGSLLPGTITASEYP
jgi:hypothetical protein